MSVDPDEFDRQNREILLKFIDAAEKVPNDISGSALATMAQFLLNYRRSLNNYKKDYLTPVEILESQVQELRRCIVNLEDYKARLQNGVTVQ